MKRGKNCSGNPEPSKPDRKEVRTMLLRWFLFETKAGEMLLSLLERAMGLAVVSVEWLETQPSGEPR